MVKTVEEICNILSKNYSGSSNADNCTKLYKLKPTLSSCANCSYIDKYNPYQSFFDDEILYNNLERKIIKQLAIAIDNNSVEQIKYLKNKYGNTKEFKEAKEYLNKECKKVWSVYTSNKNLPKEALKTLGITNQPDLEFILGNSVKYYEKDNSDTTSHIIDTTIKNENLSYTIEDIHKYLKDMNIKKKCKYNFNTVKYLIAEQNYTREKLYDLGIESGTIDTALKHLPLKFKLKFLF